MTNYTMYVAYKTTRVIVFHLGLRWTGIPCDYGVLGDESSLKTYKIERSNILS